MKSIFAAAVVAPLAFATAAYASDVQQVDEESGHSGGVRIGTLSCAIDRGVSYLTGSAKEVNCAFTSTRGRTDTYAGAIRKLGVDIGFTTRQKLIWAVFAPTAGYHRGSLAGIYEGATLEATIGAGIGGNVLVGGTSGSIHLQLLSLTGQLGLNLAATGTSMTLAAN